MKTFLLSLLVIFGIAVSASAQTVVPEVTFGPPEAGGIFIKKVEYPTLAAAVEAIHSGEAKGDTIKLMRDVVEPGVSLAATMTIDFNGFSYYIVDEDPNDEEDPTPITVYQYTPDQVVTLKNGYITVGEDTDLATILGVLGNVTLDNMILDGKHWYSPAHFFDDTALCTVLGGELVVKGNSRLLAPFGGYAVMLATLSEIVTNGSIETKMFAPKLTIEGKNVLVEGALHLDFDADDMDAYPNASAFLHFARYSQVTTPASMELELSELTQDFGFAWAKVGSKKELAMTAPSGNIGSGVELDDFPITDDFGFTPGDKIKATGLPSGIKLVKIKGEEGDTYVLQGEFKKSGSFNTVLTISGTYYDEEEDVELDYTFPIQILWEVTDIELLTEIEDPCSSENYPTPNKVSVTKGPYTLGKKVTLKATSAAGYEFEKWERYPDEATEPDEDPEPDKTETAATFSFELTEETPRKFTARATFLLRDEINEGKLFAAPPVAEGDTAALAEGEIDWNAKKVIKLEPGRYVEIPLDETIAETLSIKGFPSGLKLGKTEEGKPAIVGTPKKADTASTLVFTQKSTVKGEPAKVSGRLIIVEPYKEIDEVIFKQNDAELADNEIVVGCGEEIAPVSITYNVAPTKIVAKNLPKGIKFAYDKKTATGTLTGAIKTPAAYCIRLTATGPAGDTCTDSFWIYVDHIRQIESLNTVLDTNLLEVNMTQTKGVVETNEAFTAFNTWLAENPTAKIKGLPSGMKVTKDKETGNLAITGVPKKGGCYLVTITMKDADGNTVTTTVDLYVNAWLDVEVEDDFFSIAGGEKAMIHLFEDYPEYSIPECGILNTNLGITFPDGTRVGYFNDEGSPIDLADYTVKVKGLPKGMKLEKKVYTLINGENVTTYVITGTPKVANDEWDEEDYEDWWYTYYYLEVTLTHKATGMTGDCKIELSVEDLLGLYRQGTYVLEGDVLAYSADSEESVWPVRMVVDRPTGFGGTATVYILKDGEGSHAWEKVATLPFAYNDSYIDFYWDSYTGWYVKGDTRVAFWQDMREDEYTGEFYVYYRAVIDNLEVDGVYYTSFYLDDDGTPDWYEYDLGPAGLHEF